MTELELVTGYGLPEHEFLIRREVCACGEAIVMPLHALEKVTAAIYGAHVRGTAHLLWRRAWRAWTV